MNTFTDMLHNTWGYIAGIVVWGFDHWSGLAAFALFVLQAVYQLYRIKKARMDCEGK